LALNNPALVPLGAQTPCGRLILWGIAGMALWVTLTRREAPITIVLFHGLFPVGEFLAISSY
jgi:hypothetical protein